MEFCIFKDFINIQLIPTTLWQPGINNFLFIDEEHGLQKTLVTFPRCYSHETAWTVTKKLREEYAPPPTGEGNGTPLQYSCLENPVDRGAW